MSAHSHPSTLKRILLVEDNEEVRRSLTLLLRSWGYSVEVYRSALELLSLHHLPDADCLIIDYKMPRIDGLILLGQLRQRGSSIPAILITGFYSNSLAARAKTLGYSEVLEKPAINSQLQGTLERTFMEP